MLSLAEAILAGINFFKALKRQWLEQQRDEHIQSAQDDPVHFFNEHFDSVYDDRDEASKTDFERK